MKRVVLFVLAFLAPLCHATVTTTTFTVSFACTGTTGPYPFAFPVSSSAAITVTQGGVLLSNTAYTVTPLNNNLTNGGSITLNTACPSGGTLLVLVRVTPITQATSFTDNMPAPMKSVENALDKLTEIDQEIAATAPLVAGGTAGYVWTSLGGSAKPQWLPVSGAASGSFLLAPSTTQTGTQPPGTSMLINGSGNYGNVTGYQLFGANMNAADIVSIYDAFNGGANHDANFGAYKTLSGETAHQTNGIDGYNDCYSAAVNCVGVASWTRQNVSSGAAWGAAFAVTDVSGLTSGTLYGTETDCQPRNVASSYSYILCQWMNFYPLGVSGTQLYPGQFIGMVAGVPGQNLTYGIHIFAGATPTALYAQSASGTAASQSADINFESFDGIATHYNGHLYISSAGVMNLTSSGNGGLLEDGFTDAGGFLPPLRTLVTSGTTLSIRDNFVILNAASGSFSFTLPASPVDIQGSLLYGEQSYHACREDASSNTITINGNGNNIKGVPSFSSASTYTLPLGQGCYDIQWDHLAGVWSVLGMNPVPTQLSGTTSTITGTALTASCDSGTVTVTGAVVGHTVGVSSTTGADVGGAFNLRASVTSTNTVTVYVCGTGTPASLAYNVTTY